MMSNSSRFKRSKRSSVSLAVNLVKEDVKASEQQHEGTSIKEAHTSSQIIRQDIPVI